GDYSATLNVTSNGGSASVPVSLRVDEELSHSNPRLRLSTTSVDFGSSDMTRSLTVRNAGDAGSALNWSLDISYEGAEEEAGWLSVDPMSEITLVNTLSTVTLTARREGLAPGDYRATLAVRSNGGNDSVAVLLRVPEENGANPRPALMLSTSELDFGSGISSGALALSNTGEAGSALNWSLDISYDEEEAGWLMVEPASGSTPSGAVTTLDLTVERAGLAPGDYSATLNVTSNGGSASVRVSQRVTEGSEPAPPPALGVSSQQVNFGSSDTTRTLTLTNTGAAGSTLTWSLDLAYEGVGGWLNVSPASGSTPAEGASTVTLSATRAGLAPGNYRAVLSLTSNGGDASITVRLRVRDGQTPGELDYSVSPEVLEFGATEIGQAFIISNNHSAAIAWAAAADAPWLSIINPSSEERGQPLEPGRSDTVQVRVERSALAPGGHQATITVTAADSADPSLSGVRTIGVTVQVADAGTPELSISGQLTTANAMISLSRQEAPEGSAALAAVSTSDSTSDRARYVPGQLLIRYQAHGDHNGGVYRQTVRSLAAEFGLQTLRAAEPGAPELVMVMGSEDVVRLAARLSRDPRVLYAEPNYYLYSQDLYTQALSAQALPDDSRIGEQWALAASGLPVGWGAEAGATNPVVVAVIDSGFDLSHEDLAPRFLPGYDFCGGNDCALTDTDPSFGNANNLHGTHVAGIIGAVGNNGVGVAGVAHGSGLRLLPVKVFDDDGEVATLSSLIDSIRWSVGMQVTTSDGATLTNPNPARILNLSLGGDFSSISLQEALDDARARGALIVAATGN
ncbi:MAG: S8 family serine peptidase, partial [Deinococcota bacterium]|nr:S8 family serine peptidase [Deinococcota bacterium]